jgi:hypothetical protein
MEGWAGKVKSGDVALSSYLLRKERLRTSPNVGRGFNQERDVSVMPVTQVIFS